MPEELRAAIVLFASLLDERQRRLFAGLEALKCGWGGDRRIAQLLGIDPSTVAAGRRQLVERDVEIDRVRRAGGGRPPTKKTPEVIAHIEALMDHETAGDPLSGLKWTRRTTAKVAAELGKLGTDICARTVARLLKKMGFSLRVNHKKRAGASHPNRDDQFQHITELRARCAVENTPVISVDTQKKELVGAFKERRRQVGPCSRNRQGSRLPLRGRGPRHPLRGLRHAGQHRHRLRRRHGRHPGIRRRLHREVVAHRGAQALPRGQLPARSGRQRRQQRLYATGLEIQPATSALQPP